MNPEKLKILKNKIRNLSGQSGCYLWKNMEDEVIYVGKALDLSDRVSSYLSSSITDLKTLSLQKEISDLDWIITGSEEEALILEATLIKKYSPKYNIRLKDDKKYPYLCISVNEKFPMIYLTRNVKSDGKKYFGPFTEVKSARDLLSLVHRIFPIRKTVQTLPLKKPGRPCLNFHIKRCLGPCTGNVPEQEYNEIISQIIRFLEGKKSELIIDLQKRMQELSEEMKFERAAIYRDMIEALQAVQRRQTVVRISGGDEDILSLAKKDDHGQMVVFEVRSGRLEGKKSFAMSGMLSEKDEDI
ncbi:MAG TPA: excinuclease ABC subunit UvrC, partial [Leptospiraceae bacterium]|nr:excinuclease ABC subunit UvrC [Leptospiraceae bacterium]